MDDSAAGRAAETLLAAHTANLQFGTLGPPDRPASVADAYDIQQKFVALLRGRHGDAVGYKVGLTSAAMQTFCGIDHPIAGVVLARRVLRSGASVRRADYGRLGLEFEIAVRLKSDVPVTGRPLTVLSLVADNSWNAGIVLSDFSAGWPDLESVAGRATKDGGAIGEGFGRDILGHPFHSVAWLATQLAARGAGLRAGEVVMTGAVMKTVFPEADASYRFELERMGAVEVQVR